MDLKKAIAIIMLTWSGAIVFMIVMAVRTRAQAPAMTGSRPAVTVNALSPTELQVLRLQSLQKDLVITQEQLLDLQHQIDAGNKIFKLELDQLNGYADQVKRENSWPAGTTFNQQTLVFEKPAAPAEEKKP